VTNPSDPLKVQGYFSHSGATLKMLARLGLYNDSFPITSQNFPVTKDAYRYRTSLIDHMATNFAFTLYRLDHHYNYLYTFTTLHLISFVDSTKAVQTALQNTTSDFSSKKFPHHSPAAVETLFVLMQNLNPTWLLSLNPATWMKSAILNRSLNYEKGLW